MFSSSSSGMRCPDCGMSFRDSKLLHKHRTKFCPGVEAELPVRPTSGNRRHGNCVDGVREDIQRLELRLSEVFAGPRASYEEDNFWKQRQKQVSDLDSAHQIRLAELRERDRRLSEERTKISNQSSSLGLLAMMQAFKPRTPPPAPPPPPPPTIIPANQPFIIPPNPPNPPQIPVILEPPPSHPPHVLAISGNEPPIFPPMPPPPPIVQPPPPNSNSSAIDPTHLMLLQQLRDVDATHQSSMKELQEMLKTVERNARKETPPPVHIPSPKPPMFMPRPEPPIIINPPKQNPPPTVVHMPPPPPPPRPFTYIGGAGSILGEVASLRHAYTQHGGADGEMIFALAQLEREARGLEGSRSARSAKKSKRKHKCHKVRSAHNRLDDTLKSIEIENERLSREIALLQQQSITANMNIKASEELERKHMDYVRKLSQLEREANNQRLEQNHQDDKKRQADLTMTAATRFEGGGGGGAPGSNNFAPPVCPHGPHCAHCSGQTSSDNFMYRDQQVVPAPSFKPVIGPSIDFPPLYPDQTETSTAGMYIFWDFIIGLPPETTAIRLHSALYNDTYALGRPTSLPVFYTQQLPESSFFPYNMRVSMMSMMQQIPGCEPSADLSVIAEVHLSIASGPLTSKAWVKLDLFDEKLRVKSGRWRVPLRCVPVETSLTTTEIAQGLNQYHRAELFFRLATHNQAQTEGKQKMNPNYANYYNYLKPTIQIQQ